MANLERIEEIKALVKEKEDGIIQEYISLGKLYFNIHKDDEMQMFKDVNDILALQAEIRDLEEELNILQQEAETEIPYTPSQESTPVADFYPEDSKIAKSEFLYREIFGNKGAVEDTSSEAVSGNNETAEESAVAESEAVDTEAVSESVANEEPASVKTPEVPAFGGQTPDSSAFGGSGFGGQTPDASAIGGSGFGGQTPDASAIGGSGFGGQTPDASAIGGSGFGGQTPDSSAIGGSDAGTSPFETSNVGGSSFGQVLETLGFGDSAMAQAPGSGSLETAELTGESPFGGNTLEESIPDSLEEEAITKEQPVEENEEEAGAEEPKEAPVINPFLQSPSFTPQDTSSEEQKNYNIDRTETVAPKFAMSGDDVDESTTEILSTNVFEDEKTYILKENFAGFGSENPLQQDVKTVPQNPYSQPMNNNPFGGQPNQMNQGYQGTFNASPYGQQNNFAPNGYQSPFSNEGGKTTVLNAYAFQQPQPQPQQSPFSQPPMRQADSAIDNEATMILDAGPSRSDSMKMQPNGSGNNTMHCPTCGKDVPGANFCIFCGHKMK